MTDFQIAAASLGILLQVFSDEAERNLSSSSPNSNEFLRLNQMRTRVAEGEFWECLGGLEHLEKRLEDGFAATFKDGHYDELGKFVELRFPVAVVELFVQLRSCGISAVNVKEAAQTALPILQGFVTERFSP